MSVSPLYSFTCYRDIIFYKFFIIGDTKFHEIFYPGEGWEGG